MRLKNHAFWLVPVISSLLYIIISSCADKNNPITVGPDNGPKLTIAIDSTLDEAKAILANAISSATLSDTAGAPLATARINSGQAVFDLKNIRAGNYFVTINGLSLQRLPTRIFEIRGDSISGDTVPNISQLVNRQLNLSLLLVKNDTSFIIKTFFLGQGGRPVRKFSDGTDITPEKYAYAVESVDQMRPSLEFRFDSSAALLFRVNPEQHNNSHHFVSWILGGDNHGRVTGGDPDSTDTHCQGRMCHSNYGVKPTEWRNIIPMNGYCYKCHYGYGGISEGIVDPDQ